MQALTLPARRGWRWLSDGFLIFRKKSMMLSFLLLSYMLLMALVKSLPGIGLLAATLAIPVFSVSLMNACRLIEQGAPLSSQVLFSGFHNKNLPTLLVLGAVYIAVSVAILGIVTMVDGGILFKSFVLGQLPTEQELAGANVMPAGQLALVLFSPVMMAYWYAPVLVAWHDLGAGKALFFSFVACARNWRPFLVYGLSTAVFGALVPGMLSGLISASFPEIGGLFSSVFTALVIVVLLPTLYASFYVSYRDVFVTIDEDA